MTNQARRTGKFAVLALLTIFACTSFTWAESPWPQFRGPNADGIVKAAVVPETLIDGSIKWQIEMPGLGHSSPVYCDGKIITTSEVEGRDARQVICVDAESGNVVWTHEERYKETIGHNRLNSYAASTPAVDDDGIYVSWISGGDFILFALSHEGAEKWRHAIPCGFASRFGPGASPIVLGGIVIMTNEHAGEKCFYIGVDAKTGKVLWQTPRRAGLASYCTPKVYRPASGPTQLIMASTEHGVVSFDPKTGKINWEMPCGFTLKTCASPVIAEGIVFVSAGKGSAGREAAAVRLPDVTKGEKPEIVYRTEKQLPYVPTPVVVDDAFILWNDAGIVTSIDAKTGKAKWKGRAGGSYFSSPLLIDGKIYNISRQGDWVAMATDRFEKLATLELPEGAHSTPAVIGDRIFIRTYGKLVCIGK